MVSGKLEKKKLNYLLFSLDSVEGIAADDIPDLLPKDEGEN